MKTVPAALKTHLASGLTRLATCFKMTRRDSVVLGFTTHDRDIVFGGLTYLAATGSYTPTAVATSTGLNVDNLDVETVLDSAAITESDLVAGKYDYASVEIFEVNYFDLSQGALNLRTGTIGEITVRQTDFVGELRGVMQPLQQTIGRVYSKRCDADLGDTRCAVALGPFTVTGTVTAAANRSRFTASSVPSRAHGKLTWTSGANVGLSMEVKSLSGSEIRLILPMPYDIAVSDAYSVYAGCDKRQSTCIATFNNILNFRGHPFIPGQDKVLRYPDAHS